MVRLFILTCIGFTLSLATSVQAQWQGQEVQRDGTTYVMNPEEPLETVRVDLEELWRRGGSEDEDVLFGVISQLVQDEAGNIYLLDGQLSEIQVFSPDGEFFRTIGREGEGPGEFRNAADLYRGPDGVLGVVQVFPGRIVNLTTDGDPAGAFQLPETDGGGFQLVFVGRATPERIVLAGAQTRQVDGEQKQVTYLKAFDAKGQELAHFHDDATEMRFGNMKFEERTFSGFERRWALAPDGRVAAALDFDRYEIHVWNADGSLNRVIVREGYEPVPRNDKEKARFQRMYDGLTRWNPGSTFEISETHVAINNVWFRDDGSMWVLSGRGVQEQGEGVFASLDVFDRDGRYLSKVELVAELDATEDGLFFVGDRLYVVTDWMSAFMASMGGEAVDVEEEPEPVSVIAFQLDPRAIGMK